MTFLIVLLCFVLIVCALKKHNPNAKRVVVQLASGVSAADADRAAAEHGYVNLGELDSLAGYHVFEELDDRKRQSFEHISRHPKVRWWNEQTKHRLDKRILPRLSASSRRREAAILPEPTDPQYENQWHLKATPGKNHVHLNVVDAWRQGVYGDGVLVTVVDDGLQYLHPDLMEQFDQQASYDWNDQDDDVTPHPSNNDDHGTPAAGLCCGARNEKAVVAGDDAFCGVGVAYMAHVASLRLIAASTEDWQEAHINWAFERVDVYSNSWGPTDDGNRLEGPGPLAAAAVERAIANGRGGKGSIYVFAGGNGRGNGDSCNYDGWANWRYTVTVASVTHTGAQAWYSEECPMLIAAVPSSGDQNAIVTTDLLGNYGQSSSACMSTFGGTSASAPMAAGIVALMLDANPALGWRDVQACIIESVVPIRPSDQDWQTNGAGYNVSHRFGFGLMDAGRAVRVARNWKPMPRDAIRIASGWMHVDDGGIPAGGYLNRTWLALDETDNLRIEHVEVSENTTLHNVCTTGRTIDASSISFACTWSNFMSEHGDSNKDVDNWRFSSIICWGERVSGNWTLEMYTSSFRQLPAVFEKWHVLIHAHNDSDFGLRFRF